MLAAGRPFVTGDGGQPVRTALAWPRGALLTLAVLAFFAVGIDGGMYDWCGVYLRRMLNAPEVTAASARRWPSADWLATTSPTASLRPTWLAHAPCWRRWVLARSSWRPPRSSCL